MMIDDEECDICHYKYCKCKTKKGMNITEENLEEDTREKSFKEPKTLGSTEIVKYLKLHWGELCNYDKKEKTIYLCDNSILSEPAFVELLKKWKVFIQPSLF